MDPELQTLALQLADAAIRNSAREVIERVSVLRAKKQDKETIAELEQIINELINDKSEIIRIAQAYQDELVAQRISDEDVEFITTNIVPVLKALIDSGATANAQSAATEKMLELLTPLLSVETITIVQLLGFNFRKAIGQPLTDLVGNAIRSRTQPDDTAAIRKLDLEREIAVRQIAKDPDAYARLGSLTGRQP
jgi:hypothetical protein